MPRAFKNENFRLWRRCQPSQLLISVFLNNLKLQQQVSERLVLLQPSQIVMSALPEKKIAKCKNVPIGRRALKLKALAKAGMRSSPTVSYLTGR
jgi:hypothetical protein